MDVTIAVTIDHMLGALSIEHIPSWIAHGSGGSSCGSQIVEMPDVSAPPQFIDVIISATIDYMLAILSIEHVSARVSSGSRRSAASIGQVVMLPSWIGVVGGRGN